MASNRILKSIGIFDSRPPGYLSKRLLQASEGNVTNEGNALVLSVDSNTHYSRADFDPASLLGTSNISGDFDVRVKWELEQESFFTDGFRYIFTLGSDSAGASYHRGVTSGDPFIGYQSIVSGHTDYYYRRCPRDFTFFSGALIPTEDVASTVLGFYGCSQPTRSYLTFFDSISSADSHRNWITSNLSGWSSATGCDWPSSSDYNWARRGNALRNFFTTTDATLWFYIISHYDVGAQYITPEEDEGVGRYGIDNSGRFRIVRTGSNWFPYFRIFANRGTWQSWYVPAERSIGSSDVSRIRFELTNQTNYPVTKLYIREVEIL